MTDRIFLLLCRMHVRCARCGRAPRRPAGTPAPRVRVLEYVLRETLHGTCHRPFETAVFFETVVGMMDGAHERTHATLHDC